VSAALCVDVVMAGTLTTLYCCKTPAFNKSFHHYHYHPHYRHHLFAHIKQQ